MVQSVILQENYIDQNLIGHFIHHKSKVIKIYLKA
jgi:hypothetical protein